MEGCSESSKEWPFNLIIWRTLFHTFCAIERFYGCSSWNHRFLECGRHSFHYTWKNSQGIQVNISFYVSQKKEKGWEKWINKLSFWGELTLLIVQVMRTNARLISLAKGIMRTQAIDKQSKNHQFCSQETCVITLSSFPPYLEFHTQPPQMHLFAPHSSNCQLIRHACYEWTTHKVQGTSISLGVVY